MFHEHINEYRFDFCFEITEVHLPGFNCFCYPPLYHSFPFCNYFYYFQTHFLKLHVMWRSLDKITTQVSSLSLSYSEILWELLLKKGVMLIKVKTNWSNKNILNMPRETGAVIYCIVHAFNFFLRAIWICACTHACIGIKIWYYRV